MAEKVTTTKKRKSKKRSVPVGIAFVHSTFNNTVVTITDLSGNVVSWSSAGCHGFKGSRKSTPFAAQITAQAAAKAAMDNGMRSAQVRLKGPGSGRESALRSLHTSGLQITAIRDITPIPHNGCKPAKRRRV
jgi:small subunit ribosomal protein S11